jgi:hypothetical protein
METETLAPLMQTGVRNEYATPRDLFDALDSRFHFTLDAAALKSNARVSKYLGPDHEDPMRRNALTIPWAIDAAGGVVWINPPYGDTERKCPKTCTKKRCVKRGYHLTEDQPGQYDFIEKATNEALLSRVPTIALLPARTDTEAFHKFIYDRFAQSVHRGVHVNFLKGRITFEGEEDPAPFPSMLVAFWPKAATLPWVGWPTLGIYEQ